MNERNDDSCAQKSVFKTFAFKLIVYGIALVIVSSCIDNLSKPRLKQQKEIYQEIIKHQCKERISQQIISSIKEMSQQNTICSNDGIKIIESMREDLLKNCEI